MPRHRHQEFRAFLREIDRAVPEDLDLHLILDNYAAHKHPRVRAWLNKHPRVHFHLVPTSYSWLNLVEQFFSDLTTKQIHCDAFGSVGELVSAIEEYVDIYIESPNPFVWTKTAEILAKVDRARQALRSTPTA